MGFDRAYAPDHRRTWCRTCADGSCSVFKLFDSDPQAIQHTAHSAFEDPNTPPDAAPRQSIEVRTIAFM